jgi:AAA domain
MPASISAPSPAASVAPSTHQPPTALGLFDLHPAADAPENELLRHRFLSRQGSLLIVGNTGIGKSSLTMQMMIHWALGRGCFDMLPARPLKSLLVQGENDFEDLAEMRDGVVGGMGLNDEQRATINHRILIRHEYQHCGQQFAEEVLEPLLVEHRPDLVWLDPVLQYLGGDGNQQEVVGEFLRQQLGVLIKRYNCAVILVHHTNKPSRNGQPNQSHQHPQLHAYDGAGSAEFSNWPRAVLSLLPTKQTGEYRLVAGKRGQRLRWVMPDQTTPCFSKLLRHSRQPGIIRWEEVEIAPNPGPANPANQPAPIPNAPQPPVDAALDNGLDTADRAILAQLPDNGSVEKKVVLELVNQLTGIGDRRLRDSIKKLVALPLIVEFKVDRPGLVKAVYLRKEQPQPPQQQPQPADQPVEPPG